MPVRLEVKTAVTATFVAAERVVTDTATAAVVNTTLVHVCTVHTHTHTHTHVPQTVIFQF